MNIAKFLRIAFFIEQLWWLLLKIKSILKEFSTERHLGENSRFYYEKSRCILKDRNFIMNGRDFYDDSPMFYYEQSSFSWWQIENFVASGQNFIMSGQDFQDDGSIFSWWQLEISVTYWDFCENRSRISMLWLNLEGWGKHLTIQLWWDTICSHISLSIHPGNGIIFVLADVRCKKVVAVVLVKNRLIVKKNISKEGLL